MINLQTLSTFQERLTGGHRLCAGCGAAIVARQVLLATENKHIVVTSATGCLEVSTTIFPYSAWKDSFFHSAFSNAAATCSGIEVAYQALKQKGKVDEDIVFIVFGGDGGTADIGLQSLSGAMERGHSILYICYNNEAYMNTGVQRSGLTPILARTTTAPVGKIYQGKTEDRKDLTQIMIAHNIPYVAQTYVGNWNDLITKVQKALSIQGPSFINILTPCRLGWGYNPSETINIGKLAVETCVWPAYEVENGIYKINIKPNPKKPVIEFLKCQERFKHLLKQDNIHLINKIQKNIDYKWRILQKQEWLSSYPD
jgi:pyruvate ferredoxin oxidoreductase beta subunit